MKIPPLGQSRIPPFAQRELSPEKELKAQLELVEEIQKQMSQNRSHPPLLKTLYEECEGVVSQMAQLTSNLPYSHKESFNMHLTDLKLHMQQYHDKLAEGSSEQVLGCEATIRTTLSQLYQDLGITPPHPPVT